MLAPPKPAAPPLNSLRAFEAASRLGGFKAAAAELSVTPGAVAQHIKSLEAWAGASLFERMSQGVRLTSLGKAVAADFSQAFDHLGAAVLRLRADAGPQQIRIAVLPSIAQLWLARRMPRVRALSVNTTISITALDNPPNLLREPYDLSIFFAAEEGSGNRVELGNDRIFPVCAPSIAARLREPADLAHHTLIHDDTHKGLFELAEWQTWLDAAGVGNIDATRGGLHFNVADHGINAAVAGAGVVLGRETLAQADVEAGRLVAPFALKLKADFAFYVVSLENRAKEPAIAMFREWLLDEVAGRTDEPSVGPAV